ncbi:hypothetical protein TorRG33x02_207260, partial [Trema orientale]
MEQSGPHSSIRLTCVLGYLTYPNIKGKEYCRKEKRRVATELRAQYGKGKKEREEEEYKEERTKEEA